MTGVVLAEDSKTGPGIKIGPRQQKLWYGSPCQTDGQSSCILHSILYSVLFYSKIYFMFVIWVVAVVVAVAVIMTVVVVVAMIVVVAVVVPWSRLMFNSKSCLQN